MPGEVRGANRLSSEGTGGEGDAGSQWTRRVLEVFICVLIHEFGVSVTTGISCILGGGQVGMWSSSGREVHFTRGVGIGWVSFGVMTWRGRLCRVSVIDTGCMCRSSGVEVGRDEHVVDATLEEGVTGGREEGESQLRMDCVDE